jgi:chromosome segregation ATPase
MPDSIVRTDDLLAIVQRKEVEMAAIRAQIPYLEEGRRHQGELAIKAEAECDAARAEIEQLKAILCSCVEAIGNNSRASVDCSTDVLAHVPDEIRSATGKMRTAQDAIRQETTEANATILRLRAEATEQRERADRAEAQVTACAAPVVDMTPGMQPRQLLSAAEQLPAWMLELERLAHLPPDGPRMSAEQFQMLGTLAELDNLRRVIISGQGEAVIPERGGEGAR